MKNVPSPAAYHSACAIVRDYQKHVKTNHQLEMAIRIGSELKLKDAEVMRISEILQNEIPYTVETSIEKVEVIDGSSFEIEPKPVWSKGFPDAV